MTRSTPPPSSTRAPNWRQRHGRAVCVIGRSVRIGEGTQHRRALRHRRATPPSAATTASSSSRRIGRAPQDKKYRGEPTRWRSATATPSASSAPSHRHRAGRRRHPRRRRQLDHGLRAHGARRAGRHHTILANNATLAGHVHVGDWAIIGGFTGVHQFVHDRRPRDDRLPEPCARRTCRPS
jgi:UDP-N-acetylglucosamine acyltransferase